MKKRSYRTFFLIACIIFSACKMKYRVDKDVPYAVFTKGIKTGVINTVNKEIIIPAKFDYIRDYYTSADYPPDKNNIFYSTYIKPEVGFYPRGFLYDTNGRQLYAFDVGEGIESMFYYNKQLYAITNTTIYTDADLLKPKESHRLIRIDGNRNEILLNYPVIGRFSENNLFYFYDLEQSGLFDLKTGKKILSAHDERKFYVKKLNEIWSMKNDQETGLRYYNTVIDSTLTVKPNPFRNVLAPYDNYFFSETGKGITVGDYEGHTVPFAYPFLYRFNEFSHSNVNPVLSDRLFLFSSQKDHTKMGIINLDGEIILPEKFSGIQIHHINIGNPAHKVQVYASENNFMEYYFFAVADINQKQDEYTVFNTKGVKIIKFKNNKNCQCVPQFDMAEKDQTRIKFHCLDSLKIYDLVSKNLVHSERKY